jgi:hypothetical protein
MDQDREEAGALAALMIRMKETRLPRARRMLERVNRGETLSDSDISFLKRVFNDARSNQFLVKRHPEYHQVINKALDLYAEIITKGLENEKTRRKAENP